MSFREKNVLITGGGGHVGSVLAKAFAERGANLALVDSSGQALDRCAKEIGARTNARVTTVVADLQSSEAPGAILEAIRDWERVDVIVHTAAFVGTTGLEGWVVPFEEQRIETWEAAIKVNLTAVFAINQALYPELLRSQSPSVVHISSIYGMVGPDYSLYEGIEGMGNPAAYAVSKGGMDQLTRWMATSLAPKVRVNGINLGGVFRSQDPRFVERYCQRVPLKRMGSEEDVVGPVLFLASDDSAYVTGQNLCVDGGYTIW
jgi:NAD(P)-dependent dehydrogenase (short-subunit alcohol dehydrogenase family)